MYYASKSGMFVLGLLICLSTSCTKEDIPAMEICVFDETGEPVEGAKISAYAARLDWAAYENAVGPAVVTDQDGKAKVEVPAEAKYFLHISSGDKHNRFEKVRSEKRFEAGRLKREQYSIRPPTQWETILSGGGNLRWTLAPLMTPDGTPFLDYPVDTDMYIDGRWYDSNGRLGLWWFNENETKIFYDYATSGAIVESRMIELTEELFVAEIDFFGIRMRIEMYPS